MRAFYVLLQKEFLQIRRNSFMPRLIVVFPIMVMLVMPLVMTMDVRHVRVAVVDMDRSSTSRRLISHLGATTYFTLAGIAAQYNDALQLLECGDADVILQIPREFERNWMAGSPDKIQVTANGVNATKGSLALQYLLQSVARTLHGIRVEESPEPAPELITIQNRFNPMLDYRHYMIPALMIMLFILVCGFLPALSIVGEKERGTIEQINVTPVGRFTFTLSKLVPYWLIGLFVLTVAMAVAWLVYGLAPVGSVGAVYLGAMLFILTISGFSLTVANFSQTMQQTMFVMFFFIMIFVLMSGLLTPIASMPEWAQNITYALPPRYFVEILRSVYLKGTSLVELGSSYAALGLFALLFNGLAAVTYHKRQ